MCDCLSHWINRIELKNNRNQFRFCNRGKLFFFSGQSHTQYSSPAWHGVDRCFISLISCAPSWFKKNDRKVTSCDRTFQLIRIRTFSGSRLDRFCVQLSIQYITMNAFYLSTSSRQRRIRDLAWSTIASLFTVDGQYSHSRLSAESIVRRCTHVA